MSEVSECAGGFDFSLFKRYRPSRSKPVSLFIHDTSFAIFSGFSNQFLMSKGMANIKTTKTGTTIVGLVYKDGIVLGADTRATEGPIVADKNCEKIHYIAPNIYCCGAGTAADTEFTTNMISSKLELHRLTSGRETRVATAMTMLKQYLFRHQGHIGAALILGGVDFNGPHLFTIYPHGSTDRLPYVTMGSGSLNAMAIFESAYRPNMEKDEAVALVAAAIRAGIFNDLGSGSNVDVTIITASGAEILRNYQKPNERPPRQRQYIYPPGTTPILKEVIRPISFAVVEEKTVSSHMMED